jgi:hypothetical protein
MTHIPAVVAVYTDTRDDELLRALQRQLTGTGPGDPVVVRAAGGGLPWPLVALAAVAPCCSQRASELQPGAASRDGAAGKIRMAKGAGGSIRRPSYPDRSAQ